MNDPLVRIQTDLENIKQGLELLGIKQCSRCGKFYRSADHGALFESIEVVCYACLGDWWKEKIPHVSTSERYTVEQSAKRWLCAYHKAIVVRHLKKLPQNPTLKIVTACETCGGTAAVDGRWCSNCEGRGTVWVVVVPEP
jgi:hypothetical protein